MKVLFSLIIVLILSIVPHPAPAQEGHQDVIEAKKTLAVSAAEEIVRMRSTLARNFIKPGMEITEETFR